MADGRKLLVIHGDQFDGIVRYARWLAILGDWAYATALRINTTFNWGRRKLGLPYWSLSAYLKHKVKNAVQFIDNYEHAVATEARRRGRPWRGLRSHPPRRDPHHRRHPLLQRRRLGRELHRFGRGFRRPPAHRALGRRACATRERAAASQPGPVGGRVDPCASPSSPTPGDRRSTAWCAPSRPWQNSCAPRVTTSRCSVLTVSAPCRARPIPRSASRCSPRRASITC